MIDLRFVGYLLSSGYVYSVIQLFIDVFIDKETAKIHGGIMTGNTGSGLASGKVVRCLPGHCRSQYTHLLAE